MRYGKYSGRMKGIGGWGDMVNEQNKKIYESEGKKRTPPF
jgi:hypothetical protein